MPLKPGKYSHYNISGISHGGNDDFAGYGSDKSHSTDDIIYIGSHTSERTVAFKAFLNNYSYKITKNISESLINSFAAWKNVTENEAKIVFDITLDVPAHSVNESANNLAKIAELQRMISPTVIHAGVSTSTIGTGGDLAGLPPISTDRLQNKVLLSVFFKNLLNSGEYWRSVPNIDSWAKLQQYGVIVNCLNVKYEPDVEMGFHYSPDSGRSGQHYYPKNIKLSLSLEVNHEESYVTGKRYIRGFSTQGQLLSDDSMFSPFNIGVVNSSGESGNPGVYDKSYYAVNNIKTQIAGANSFLFISNKVSGNGKTIRGGKYIPNKDMYSDGGSSYKRQRWVMFDNFLTNFSRDLKYDKMDIIDSEKDFSTGYQYSKYSSLSYSISIDVPSKSWFAAENNLGKIQILSRLLAKKAKVSYAPFAGDDSSGIGSSYEEWGGKDIEVKVYIPSMLEKAGAATGVTNSSYSHCFNNAVDLVLTSFDVNFDAEAGFFRNGGKLYPKVFKLNLNFVDRDLSKIQNFGLNGSDSTLDATGDLLFPYNRKYTKVTKAGS
jgi:hypothetical protein